MDSNELTKVTKILTEAGLQDSVWGKRIIQATKGTWDDTKARFVRGFTLHDVLEAGSWVTCACGEITAGIPRGDGVNALIPQDEVLVRLGNQFSTDVGNDTRIFAAKTLVAIEKRATVVAKENSRG